ncbi:hypothetical protein L7F22_046974 [Adiantum nelumboides]|nr:hypothetical protein [Adiantum nelumboides]
MACQRRLSLTEIPDLRVLFWKAIWENIGMRLQFSSSFHPQTDGQSEIANSVVLDLLKSYISDQKTQWKRCLPLVEFAYNNTIHSSTGKAPFEIVEGVRKVPPFLSTKDKILEANEYTRDLDTDFAKIRETLQKSQERQKKAADLHRRDSKLKENDWVLLRFDKARLRQKKGKEELRMRYYGPFQITEQINDISFRLRLPDTRKIHNVFHVNLWKTFGDVPDDGEPDEQPEVEANEEILVPEQELSEWNKKYEEKFGFRFLICASGKSSTEILANLQTRFSSRPIEELQVAAGEQQKITELRLGKLFADSDLSNQTTGNRRLDQVLGHLGSAVEESKPGLGIAVMLELWNGPSKGREVNGWTPIGSSITDADGQSGPLMAPSNTVKAGRYKVTFDTSKYFQNSDDTTGTTECFYPYVSVVFEIKPAQVTQHFHVPVLLSPFSYTTYRGS